MTPPPWSLSTLSCRGDGGLFQRAAIVNIIGQLIVGATVVIATYRGPISAAELAEKSREEAQDRSNKMALFRQMMGNRLQITNRHFVNSLNLVQIEFHNFPEIMEAYEAFLPAVDIRNQATQLEINNSVVKLLCGMGDRLGYKLSQLDLMASLYMPQSMTTLAQQEAVVRDLIVDMATGKRKLPVEMSIVQSTYSQ